MQLWVLSSVDLHLVVLPLFWLSYFVVLLQVLLLLAMPNCWRIILTAFINPESPVNALFLTRSVFERQLKVDLQTCILWLLYFFPFVSKGAIADCHGSDESDLCSSLHSFWSLSSHRSIVRNIKDRKGLPLDVFSPDFNGSETRRGISAAFSLLHRGCFKEK